VDSGDQAPDLETHASKTAIVTLGQTEVSNRSILPKINFVVSISTFLLLVVGLVFAWGPITQYRNTDPTIDGYVQPRSIADLVALVQDSTVSIY